MRRRLAVATAHAPPDLFLVRLRRPLAAAPSLIVTNLMGLESVLDMEPRNVRAADAEGLDADVAADPRSKSVDQRNISLCLLDHVDT